MAGGVLTRLLGAPIRLQLALIAVLLAVPAASLIISSALRSREAAIHAAENDAQELADEIAFTQQNLVSAAQQLLVVLAQLPEVRDQQAERVRAILRDCLKLNAQYSNIFIADRQGRVWASAVDAAPFNVADRRYFRRTLETGQLSSGEYVKSRATGRAAFNLGYPLRDGQGGIAGVISVGFNLDRHRELLQSAKTTVGSSYLLLDHAGTVLSRGLQPDLLTGKQYDSDLFDQMVRGPDKDSLVATSMAGDVRLIAYRKLRLPGEPSPYLYVRAGIPMEAVLASANRALAANLALFLPLFVLAILLALLLAKRAIADRTTQLQLAAQRLAAGDLSVRVSDVVVGGELGALARTFDEMARQVAERERARQLSQQLYQNFFEVESDALFLLEQESGRILEVNPAASRLLGYSRDELLAMRNSDLSTEPELTRLKTLGGSEGQHVLSEPTVRCKDGRTIECEVASGFFTWDGKAAVLSAMRDLTSRKRSEQERRGLGEQLAQAQKMEAVGRLAGGVAHDFNNLLTVIAGSCDLLHASLAGQPELLEDVELIRSAARSAAALTGQLLIFSRKQVLRPRIIDLNEVVRSSERMLQRVIGENVRLETRLEPAPWHVRADPLRLEQVIVNLAVNARDAMPGGGTLRIETANVTVEASPAHGPGVVEPGHYVLLTVSDTGHGMEPQTLVRIFEPFFTTKPEGKGTGLGLSTVYGIVQQSGGQVVVESAPGRHTTFGVYLPRQEGAVSPALTPPSPVPLDGEGETILVAEDSDGVRQLVTQVLRKAGYQVLEASSGEEALRVAERHQGPIHLFLADVVMPGMNGR
jgi:PAS domain S-box-containing protein